MPPGKAQEGRRQRETCARRAQHEAKVADQPQTRKGGSLHDQRRRHNPQQECGGGAEEPARPSPRQRSISLEQAALEPVRSDTETGEEKESELRRKARLKRERTALHPLPRLERGGERQIGQRRDAYQRDEELAGMAAGLGRQSAQGFARARGEPKERGGHKVEQQEQPQEPYRPARPERQRN